VINRLKHLHFVVDESECSI